MVKKMKYAEGGSIDDSDKKRKPLPSETIKENKTAKDINEGIKNTILSGITGGASAIGSLGKRAYQNVMGTPEQNAAADAREAARARANPEGYEAKFRDFVGEEYKKGGKVSSASKRGDGCAIRGKTKGRMV